MKTVENGSGHLLAVDDTPAPAGIPVASNITVYTKAWKADSPAKAGELPYSQIHGRIFVNDSEIEAATGITIDARGGGFLTASITVLPGTVQIVPLDEDAWKALGSEHEPEGEVA